MLAKVSHESPPRPPVSMRAWLFRLLAAAAIYGVLLLPWPGMASGYAFLFRAVNQVVLNALFSPAEISMTPRAPTGIQPLAGRDSLDTRVHGQVGRSSFQFALTTRRTGYTYTALLAALVLASPVPVRRRLRALLLGVPLLHIVVAAALAIKVVAVMSGAPEIATVRIPAWAGPIATYAAETLLSSRAIVMAATVAIWVAVTLRAPDFRSDRLHAGETLRNRGPEGI